MLLFSGLILFDAAAASARSAPTEEEMYQKARKSYYSLKASKKKRKYRHNWIRVINDYKRVYERFHGGKRGDDSLYMAAKLYIELNAYSGRKADLKRANGLLRALTREYPKSRFADDAWFMMGQNHEKLGDKRLALEAYSVVVEKYSKGDRFKDARKKVRALSKTLSRASPGKGKSKGGSAAVKPRKRSAVTYITGIRHWSNPNYTRIVVDLDRQARYKSHLLRRDPSIGKPPRLYIDIFGARKKGRIKEMIPIHDGLLKRARAAQYDHDTVRVVLDIESIKDYKIFPMVDPYRIIIDVRGDDSIRAPGIEALLPGDEAGKKTLKEALEEENLSLSRQLGLGIRKIVIDPGHGGKDPGAIGPGGTKEKEVTLRLARRLKDKLEKKFGYRVILTRSDDRYLRLEERTAIANMENADLFISIHANANRNRRAYGIETYVMNARATDRYAAEVAARENAVTSNSMGEFGSILEEILVDMQKTNKVNESNRLASSIQSRMTDYMQKRYNRIRSLGVKRGPFYVLIGANMPSILIETGFISNRMEERRLSDDRYIDHLSNAIALGVEKYSSYIKTASRI